MTRFQIKLKVSCEQGDSLCKLYYNIYNVCLQHFCFSQNAIGVAIGELGEARERIMSFHALLSHKIIEIGFVKNT